jgi:hypothetical protein
MLSLAVRRPSARCALAAQAATSSKRGVKTAHGAQRRHQQFAHQGVALGVAAGCGAFRPRPGGGCKASTSRLAALGVVQQVVLQIGVALHHPDVAQHLVQHARRAAGAALLAQLVQQLPGRRAQQADHDLAVGERGVVVRDFAFCIANGYALNIEIKPTTGDEAHTGTVVAQHAARLWQNAASKPLLTSFAAAAVHAAQAAAPQLPRGLLLDTLWEGWLNAAKAMGCVAVICKYTLWNASHVQAVHAAGMRALSYTVNEPSAADTLLALGTDGLITDRVDYFFTASSS